MRSGGIYQPTMLTEEVFLLLVRVDLLVLVWYATLLKHDPDALHEWTELIEG